MSLRLISATLAGTVVLMSQIVGPSAAARPPDLPKGVKDVCIPLTQESPIAPVPQTTTNHAVDAHKLAEAGRMFRIGERCRREGDIDMAINCYQETELLCPNSGYARLAAERLKQLKRDTSVEATSTVRPAIFDTEADLTKILDARLMVEVGKRCEAGGDLDSALRCYEEAHRICPASRYGQQALQRVVALEKHRATQEPPVVGEDQARQSQRESFGSRGEALHRDRVQSHGWMQRGATAPFVEEFTRFIRSAANRK